MNLGVQGVIVSKVDPLFMQQVDEAKHSLQQAERVLKPLSPPQLNQRKRAYLLRAREILAEVNRK